MSDISMSNTTSGYAPSDRYSLLEVIGTGSFGEVWRARDTATNKEVAVKVVDLDEM